MAKNKTNETIGSVTDFVNAVDDETKRKDSFKVIELMQQQTGFEPKMWGPSIIGFGSYHYKYDSGHEGDAPLLGFSPRASAITFYISLSADAREEFLSKLGKHRAGKGCIYVKKLDDIDIAVLKQIISDSVKYMRGKYSV